MADLPELSGNLDALNLNDEYLGKEVPQKPSMSVIYAGPRNTDYTVAFRGANAQSAAVEIAIYRTYNSRQGRPTSTVAVLQRGSEDPLRIAERGWSKTFEKSYQIDNAVWTEKVFELCKLVGHELKTMPFLDQKVPGHFSACHPEKQLAAYHFFRDGSRAATIHMSAEPCQDCLRFFQTLRKKQRLQFELIVDGETVKY